MPFKSILKCLFKLAYSQDKFVLFFLIVITCPALPDPMNGVVTYTHSEPQPYSFGTTAEYRCETGFGLSGGDSTRSCEGDGSSPFGIWSGDAPTYEGFHSH